LRLVNWTSEAQLRISILGLPEEGWLLRSNVSECWGQGPVLRQTELFPLEGHISGCRESQRTAPHGRRLSGLPKPHQGSRSDMPFIRPSHPSPSRLTISFVSWQSRSWINEGSTAGTFSQTQASARGRS